MKPLVFMDRGRRAGRYPWFEWKVRLFVVGAALGVVGIGLSWDLLVLAGILVLAAGLLVRFLPGGRGVDAEPDAEDSHPS